MKRSKILSVVLSLSMVGSMLVLPITTQASGEETTLVNLVENGDFENGMPEGVAAAGGTSELSRVTKDGNSMACFSHVDGQYYTVGEIAVPTTSEGRSFAYSFKLAAEGEGKVITHWGKGDYICQSAYPNFTTVKGTGESTISGSSAVFLYQFAYMWAESGAKYYLDDVEFYDITDAHKILADDGIVLDSKSYVDINGDKMTNTGDTVRFTLTDWANVKMNGATLSPDASGTYSFTMPDGDAKITVSDIFGDPAFTENFSGYTSDGGAVCAGRMEDAYTLANGKKIIAAQSPDVRWETSAVNKGVIGDWTPGAVYVNPDERALRLRGGGSYAWSQINLNVTAVKNIQRAKFTIGNSWNRAAGAALFTDAAQTQGLVFGVKTGGEEVSNFDSSFKQGMPFVAAFGKKDGNPNESYRIDKKFDNDANIISAWPANASMVAWDVSVESYGKQKVKAGACQAEELRIRTRSSLLTTVSNIRCHCSA